MRNPNEFIWIHHVDLFVYSSRGSLDFYFKYYLPALAKYDVEKKNLNTNIVSEPE